MSPEEKHQYSGRVQINLLLQMNPLKSGEKRLKKRDINSQMHKHFILCTGAKLK